MDFQTTWKDNAGQKSPDLKGEGWQPYGDGYATLFDSGYKVRYQDWFRPVEASTEPVLTLAEKMQAAGFTVRS